MDKQSKLLLHHEKSLLESGISPEVIESRGYFSATEPSQLKKLGFNEAQQRLTPSLVIPVRNEHGIMHFAHIRPDSPREDYRSGKIRKYEFPAETSMALDASPLIHEQLRNPKERLIITEGVKKADSAISRGLCCVALLGVWNFRGTNEYGGKTLLADFESIALNDREVIVAYDSDVICKPSVASAMERLGAVLKKRGAKVRYLFLPSQVDGSKTGLDDFFVAGRTVEDMLGYCENQLRPSTGTELPNDYENRADGLYHFTTGRGGVLETKHLTNFTARILAETEVVNDLANNRIYTVETTLNGQIKQFEVSSTV